MTLWPQSLYRQILLVVALALFCAQAFNAYMLFAGTRARSNAEAAAMLVARVSNQAERMAERGRSWGDERVRGNRRRRPSIVVKVGPLPLVVSGFRYQEELTSRAEEFLAQAPANLSGIAIASGPIAALPQELQIPFARPAFAVRLRTTGSDLPRESLLLTARTEDGQYLTAAAFVRPLGKGAVWALVLQTLTLYIAVLVPLALVARRIVRPLERLKERVAAVGVAGEVAPLQSEGPADIRDLIDSFNMMQSRVSSLLSEKDVMLGAIGHDLKTPLAALRVRIESVEDDVEREKMASSIDELVRILDDILTLARLGKSGETMQKTDLAALVESILDEFDTTASPISWHPPAERTVAALRPVLIRRALRNLIGNALKHGGSAAVSVAQAGSECRVMVDDNGPGISAEEIEDMFAPFVRADASRNRATGGSGLGLTIARAIARSHGGDVVLSNRAGGGLRATLILPLSQR